MLSPSTCLTFAQEVAITVAKGHILLLRTRVHRSVYKALTLGRVTVSSLEVLRLRLENWHLSILKTSTETLLHLLIYQLITRALATTQA